MRATRVKSTSKNDVTCAFVRRESAMCSAVSVRMRDMGSTTSPCHGSGSGPWCSTPVGACMDGATRGAAAGGAPDSITCMMSRLVTRPAMPLPCRFEISMPCSAAILRTSGDDFVRSLSSIDPPLPDGRAAGCNAAGATAGVWLEMVDGFAVDSWRGGPPLAATAGDADAGTGDDDAGAGAVAAGIATAPASVSMRATTVCTGTVCPSVTSTSASTPDVGDGISASTLSVEISKIGSSRLIASPTFFSQRDIVPSAIDSPIWGITTSTRANGSTSRLSSLPNVAAPEPPQHQHRQRDGAQHRAHQCIGCPVTDRQPLTGRRLPQPLHESPDQHRDHTTAPESDERREASDAYVARRSI